MEDSRSVIESIGSEWKEACTRLDIDMIKITYSVFQ